MRRLRRISRLLTLSLTWWASGASLAAPLWSDFSGAFVAGRGFTLDPDKQHTVSLEYASGYRWGDTFTYLDTTFFRGDERTFSLFGETSTRWSIMDSDEDRSNQAVTDVLVASSLEFGSGTV